MPLVTSGVEHGNLRELAMARMKDWGTSCRDVRTREVGIQQIHNQVQPYEVLFVLYCITRGIRGMVLQVQRFRFSRWLNYIEFKSVRMRQ